MQLVINVILKATRVDMYSRYNLHSFSTWLGLRISHEARRSERIRSWLKAVAEASDSNVEVPKEAEQNMVAEIEQPRDMARYGGCLWLTATNAEMIYLLLAPLDTR